MALIVALPAQAALMQPPAIVIGDDFAHLVKLQFLIT